MINKCRWYLGKFFNLLWANLNLLGYFILHPKVFSRFLFSVFSEINEFHKMSFGRLKDFESTDFFRQLSSHFIFAQSNLFNRDPKVTRSMETHFLATLVKELNPLKIFEIGTYNGFTALHMAVNSPPSCQIYTLDLPADYQPSQVRSASYDDLMVIKLSQETINQRLYKGHPLSHKIKELYGDSAVFNFSEYYGKMDIVFIDGNHSFGYVKSDTENAFKMLSDHGVIVWHDYDYIIHKDVFSYLNGLASAHSIYSVPHTRFAIYLKNEKLA